MLTLSHHHAYLSDARREARAVATAAEARKREKYALLFRFHHFVPIAIENSGALGPDALSLLTDVRRASHMTTSPSHSFSRECPLHSSTAMGGSSSPSIWGGGGGGGGGAGGSACFMYCIALCTKLDICVHIATFLPHRARGQEASQNSASEV